MSLERIFNILGSLVALGTVTVVLSSQQTAKVIEASGTAFTQSLRAAMGR
jgi:hypothetical protein